MSRNKLVRQCFDRTAPMATCLYRSIAGATSDALLSAENWSSNRTVAAIFNARAAHADSLKPFEARDIDLGTLTDTVYQCVDTDPFRVIAMLQSVGEIPVPMRFIGTPSPGQESQHSAVWTNQPSRSVLFVIATRCS